MPEDDEPRCIGPDERLAQSLYCSHPLLGNSCFKSGRFKATAFFF